MKDASRIMYTIGKVFNIIGIVFTTLFIVFPIIMMSIPDQIYAQQKASDANKLTVEQIKVLGVGLLIGVIIAIIILIVELCLATYAKNRLNNNKKDTVPHVIMIIIGVFGSIFYLIGGILGLVAEENENQGSLE